MAMKKQTDPTNKENFRRRILKWLWAGLGVIAFFELLVIILSFFKTDKTRVIKNEGDNQFIDAGHVNSYPPGSVKAFIRGRFYIAHVTSGGFIAVSNQCTHLGCSVPWDESEKKFICPCHASQFDITGKVLSSPAPRALDYYKIKITNGQLLVDVSDKIKRNSFNPNQLVFPDDVKVSKP